MGTAHPPSRALPVCRQGSSCQDLRDDYEGFSFFHMTKRQVMYKKVAIKSLLPSHTHNNLCDPQQGQS